MISLRAAPRLDDAVSTVGVKPAESARLAKLGILTVRELLLALPFDWDSYGHPTPVAQLTPGQSATVVGTALNIHSRKPRFNRGGLKTITQGGLRDDNGDELSLIWFNQNFVGRRITPGDRIAVAGVVKQTKFGGLQMSSPHWELLDDEGETGPKAIGGLMPKYHLVEGLSARRRSRSGSAAALPLAASSRTCSRPRCASVTACCRSPTRFGSGTSRRRRRVAEARRRMAFAELFELQAAFALMRASIAAEPATPIPYRQEVIDTFKAGLGFELTRAQRRATWEAFQDMARHRRR